MNLIKAKHLNVFYENTHALKDVSFELDEGDFLCIVGENGSGKSTLVKTLLGLVKAKSGELVMHAELKNDDFGYVPQVQPMQKDFPASVSEVVLSGCVNKHKLRPFYRKSEKSCAIDNMERLDILYLKNKAFRDLSGGQKQRVLIARALCASNKILLLDEPTTGLDPEATESLYELIKKLNKELGITIIMITHDVKDGLFDANKVLHLRREVLFYGSLQDYQNDGLHNCHRGGLAHV
jgi:zinc transport system ATP-binding protein